VITNAQLLAHFSSAAVVLGFFGFSLFKEKLKWRFKKRGCDLPSRLFPEATEKPKSSHAQ